MRRLTAGDGGVGPIADKIMAANRGTGFSITGAGVYKWLMGAPLSRKSLEAFCKAYGVKEEQLEFAPEPEQHTLDIPASPAILPQEAPKYLAGRLVIDPAELKDQVHNMFEQLSPALQLMVHAYVNGLHDTENQGGTQSSPFEVKPKAKEKVRK